VVGVEVFVAGGELAVAPLALAVCTGVARSMISGAGARRQPRPTNTPQSSSTSSESDGLSHCVFANVREHLSQNRRLVQTNQRSRTILWPHSQQKLGR